MLLHHLKINKIKSIKIIHVQSDYVKHCAAPLEQNAFESYRIDGAGYLVNKKKHNEYLTSNPLAAKKSFINMKNDNGLQL